jgi:DHA1 family tetracycline resistance protein-like MFS transporter
VVDFARRRRGDAVVLAASATEGSASILPASLPAWRRHASVACVMLAVFLHLLGFTVTGPITPGLVQHFALHPSQVGYLTSAYPLGMFFALFAWPRLSDEVGRKPILALSLFGVGCGLIAQAQCVQKGWSLGAFLALRVCSGAFAGASPIVKAYLADVATEKQLPQFMAWREACCTLAFIAGPTLGGWFFHGTKSLSACIYVTGFASVAAAALVAAVMVEGRVMDAEEDDTNIIQKDTEQTNDTTAVSSSLSPPSTASAAAAARAGGAREAEADGVCPLGTGLVTAVATICVVSFLYNAGQSTFDSFFPIYAAGTLGMGPTKIGGTLTSLAAISFGVSAFFFSKVQEILGLTLTAAAGLGLVAVGLCGVGLAGSEFGAVAAAAVYVSGIPLFTPAVPILLMQCVPKNQRGAVMGLDSAVNSVARIATPIAFGNIYVRGSGQLSAPFLAAGGVVAFAALVVVFRRWSVLGGFRGGGKGWRGGT